MTTFGYSWHRFLKNRLLFKLRGEEREDRVYHTLGRTSGLSRVCGYRVRNCNMLYTESAFPRTQEPMCM